MMETTYRPATWFKILCWVLAVICAVFLVLFPGSLVMIWLAVKAKVVTYDDRIEITWFGTRSIPWSDIGELQWGRAAGAIGAAMRPLSYRAGVKGKSGNIAIGAFENSDQLLQTIREKTGLTVS